MVLPLMMSVTFTLYPAGLVFHWPANALIAIARQRKINRRIEIEAKREKRRN